MNYNFEAAVRMWENFVFDEILDPRIMVEDVLLNLDNRQSIHENWHHMTPGDLVGYVHRIREADAEYKRLTLPMDRCLWGERNRKKTGWTPDIHWWYFRRLPREGMDRLHPSIPDF